MRKYTQWLLLASLCVAQPSCTNSNIPNSPNNPSQSPKTTPDPQDPPPPPAVPNHGVTEALITKAQQWVNKMTTKWRKESTQRLLATLEKIKTNDLSGLNDPAQSCAVLSEALRYASAHDGDTSLAEPFLDSDCAKQIKLDVGNFVDLVRELTDNTEPNKVDFRERILQTFNPFNKSRLATTIIEQCGNEYGYDQLIASVIKRGGSYIDDVNEKDDNEDTILQVAVLSLDIERLKVFVDEFNDQIQFNTEKDNGITVLKEVIKEIKRHSYGGFGGPAVTFKKKFNFLVEHFKVELSLFTDEEKKIIDQVK
jgi:hypothetical protein